MLPTDQPTDRHDKVQSRVSATNNGSLILKFSENIMAGSANTLDGSVKGDDR